MTTQVQTRPQRKPTGGPGLGQNYRSAGGFVTPRDYLNAEWSHPALYRTSDQMYRTDPVVRAAVLMILLPVIEATWTFTPASPDPKDVEAAEFARRALLEHLDWPDTLWQLLAPALRYGHGLLEEVYEPVEWSLSIPTGEDGVEEETPKRMFWTPAAFIPRPGWSIMRWKFDDLGALEYVEQLTGADRSRDLAKIPASQLLVLFNEREGQDDLGRPVLRSMYRPWYAKEKLEIIDMIRAEKAGVGVPVGRVGSNKPDGEIDALEEQLQSFGANEQGYFILDGMDDEGPDGMDIQMLDMKASSTADVLSSLRYHVEQILWAVLGAWQNLGQGQVGARATAEVQDDPFYLGLRYIAGRVAAAVTRQHLPRLIGFNYPDARVPLISVADIQGTDVGTVTESIAKLITAGAIEHDDDLEAHLRDVMGLPPKRPVDEADDEQPPEFPPPAPDDEPVPPEPDAPAPDDTPPPAEEVTKAALHRITQDLAMVYGMTAQAAVTAVLNAATQQPDEPAHPTRLWLELAAAGDVTSDLVTQEEARRVLEAGPRAWAREPTALEARHVPLAEIDATVQAQRLRFQDALQAHAHAVATHLATRELPDEAETRLREELAVALERVAAYGRMTVRREVASQTGRGAVGLVDRPPTAPERLEGWITKQARRAAAAILSRLEGAVDRAAARETPPMGEALALRLREEADRAVRAEAVATVSHAFGAGRRAEQADMADEGWRAVYSSVLDRATCGPCTSLDGREYMPGTVEFARDYPPLFGCDGGDACRCMMVLISPDEIS